MLVRRHEMKRRSFIANIIIGLSGAAIAAHIPTTLVFNTIPKPYLTGSVEAYMRKLYNDFVRKNGGKSPTYIEAGRALFEKYESRIQALQRFTSMEPTDVGYRTLAFKSCRMRCVGDGWDIKMFLKEPTIAA
jgi:hypothetical protein